MPNVTRAGGGIPVAIVGIGCRFPGGIVDAESFWNVLANGVDAIGEIPHDRFDIERYYDARPQTPGKTVSRLGGFVQQSLQDFDAEFFGISRTNAERLDPQQRLLLESSWEAMEDAGLDVESLRGSPTSVFVGQWASDFEHRLFANHDTIDFQMTLGSGRYATAGRVSHAFGLRGESLTIDTGCSAGLAAVHLAVRSLRQGDSTVAIAAGVNVIMQPHIHVAYSQSGMMAADGRCKFGDAAGDGYVRSEGCGVVVLKPLDAAIANGDRVYAVIRGTALNNDGDTGLSLGSPSGVAHEDVIRSALRDAGVAPADVAYVEAHGTGTRAGDPLEINAIATVLADGRDVTSRAWVGSVKTNLGHTESAAGLAGLIKGALMVQRGQIPPSLHVRTLNPAVDWDSLALAIPRALQPWPAGYQQRVVGVSSLGIGGTNAHVVLSEPNTIAQKTVAQSVGTVAPSLFVLPLSARSDSALRALAVAYADKLGIVGPARAMAVCVSAATRRTALSHRVAFVETDVTTLIAALRTFAAGAPAAVNGIVHERTPRAVAFVVPGQGGQWLGMARELLAFSVVFRAAFEQCDIAARAFQCVSLVDQLHLSRDDAAYVGDRIDVIQPTLVALSIAYAAWLRSVGIVPSAVVGHSMGEVAASAIAGRIDINSAMKIVCLRSALMQRVSGHGAMAVIELSADETQARIGRHSDTVSIAAINSARSTVISGDPDVVRALHDELEAEGIFCRIVQVDVAAHSAQMAPLAVELQKALAGIGTTANTPKTGAVPMTSTVTGEPVDDTAPDATYWARNLREPVQFARAIKRVLDDGIELFVELGPHGVLTQSVEHVAQSMQRDVTVVACGHRDSSDIRIVHEAMAALWCAGAKVDWAYVMPAQDDWASNDVQLPLYPWQRERFWVTAADIAPIGAAIKTPAADPKLLAMLHAHTWERLPSVPNVPAESASVSAASARWIVVAGAHANGTNIVRELLERGATAHVVASIGKAAEALRHDARSSACPGIATQVLLLPANDADIAFSPVAAINTFQNELAASDLSPPRLWWLTNGAHVVADRRASDACAERAAAWGAARVIAEEHPQWWGGLIDLDVEDVSTNQTSALVDHLLCASGEELVALRDGQKYAMRIEALNVVPAQPFRWRADASYLLTGGFGGVATHLAHSMVQHGARRIILLSRTALPARAEWLGVNPASPTGKRIAAVRTLEAAGCAVHIMCADAANEFELRAAIAAFAAEGWPPIAGVIHLAAELDNRLSHDMTRDVFDRVLSAKLGGAQLLDRMFPALDVFVLASSVSATVMQPGMSNYTAANAGCDALAMSRRQRGQHALSIQWSSWDDVGMHQNDRDRLDVQALERLGVSSIVPAQASTLFHAMLAQTRAVVAVLPIQPDVFAANASASRRRLFSHVLETQRGLVDAARVDDDDVRKALLGASPMERKQQLEALVTESLSSILRRPASDIGARRTFGSMGFDSLMGLALRNKLERALQRPLSATLAWNYPTVDALSAHLATFFEATPQTQSSHPARAEALPGTGVTADANSNNDLAALIGSFEELSDDDTARLLRASRSAS